MSAAFFAYDSGRAASSTGAAGRLYVEALGGVYQPVLDGRASLGIAGPAPTTPTSMTSERVAKVAFLMVAAQGHPLASFDGIIPKAELAKHIQLVLTDRSELSADQEVGVTSPLTWRLADLFAKNTFLLNGLGWGGMPLHAVQADIASKRLVALEIEDVPPGGLILPMFAVYRTADPPGPAGRWLIERVKQCPGKRAPMPRSDP